MAEDSVPAKPGEREVGIALTIGIALVPFIFVWFLLRHGYSNAARAAGFAWLVVFVIAVNLSPKNEAVKPAAPSNEAAQSASTNATAVAPAPAATPDTKWTYSEDTDAMRGTKTRYASVESETETDFGFPYGAGKAELTLRRRPSDGLNILLHAKGQFLCHSFNDDTVAVKFDDGPIEHYGCNEPTDASTGWLFIESPARFLSHLKKSKSVIIEAPFFQHGRQQITFDIRNLNWK